MHHLRSLLVLLFILSPAVGLGSAAGPFPQIQPVDSKCGPAPVVPAGGPLRITYQNVAQSCAVQRCSVIYDEPLDAGDIKVEWTDEPQGGKRTTLPGAFVKTKETCGARPVWVFDGEVPAKGAVLFVSPKTTYGYIHIRKVGPETETPSE